MDERLKKELIEYVTEFAEFDFDENDEGHAIMVLSNFDDLMDGFSLMMDEAEIASYNEAEAFYKANEDYIYELADEIMDNARGWDDARRSAIYE